MKESLGNEKATFVDLHKQASNSGSDLKDLYITALNTQSNQTAVMSFENDKYKNQSIALAVRASMAIPLFFTPVNFDGDKADYVDGGVLDNYPVYVFDRKKYANGLDSLQPIVNDQTLGFKLVAEEVRNIYEERFYEKGGFVKLTMENG